MTSAKNPIVAVMVISITEACLGELLWVSMVTNSTLSQFSTVAFFFTQEHLLVGYRLCLLTAMETHDEI